MIPSAFWEGLAAGLGLSVALAVTARWLLERWARRERPTTAPGSDGAVTAPGPAGLPPVELPASRAPAPAEPPVPVATDAPSGSAARAVPPGEDYGTTPTNGGQVRISQRVLFHIAAQGRIGADEVAPRPLCQAGIGEALHVSQGALTGVLRRLVAAGILEEKRQHVRGTDRRVKVYRMTANGYQLYRELRGRNAGPDAGRRPRGPAR